MSADRKDKKKKKKKKKKKRKEKKITEFEAFRKGEKSHRSRIRSLSWRRLRRRFDWLRRATLLLQIIIQADVGQLCLKPAGGIHTTGLWTSYGTGAPSGNGLTPKLFIYFYKEMSTACQDLLFSF